VTGGSSRSADWPAIRQQHVRVLDVHENSCDDAAGMTASPHPRRHHDVGFLAIAIFKLVKAAVLLAVGLGALSLLDQEWKTRVAHWAHRMMLDEHSRFVQKFLLRLGVVRHRDIALVSGTTFFYAALLLAEGVGLLRERVWAEYLTFIVTASFMPMEAYGLTRHLTVARLVVLVINGFVAGYLALRLHQRVMAKRRLTQLPLPA
jgi:uncharacterized membrane protein (DUF2068 family)